MSRAIVANGKTTKMNAKGRILFARGNAPPRGPVPAWPCWHGRLGANLSEVTMQPRLFIPAFGPLYRALTPVTEPLVRVVAGLSLAIHGYPILFTQTAAAARFFQSIGFENGLVWAYVVGALEFFCGLFLALGLLTRLVAVPFIAFLLMTIATYHWHYGFAWENRGFEYPLFWSIVVFHFLVRGGGAWSLDAAIGREL
jgi:putative oxidoreductase